MILSQLGEITAIKKAIYKNFVDVLADVLKVFQGKIYR